jgi:hypothetical protein
MAAAIMSNDYSVVDPVAPNRPIKYAPSSSWARYLPMTFGHDPQMGELANCSTLALNIGQWPLSYRAGDRPWSPGRYLDAVESLVGEILRQAPHLNGSLAWVSTQPLGLGRALHGRGPSHPPKDWRTDPLVLRARQESSLGQQKHAMAQRGNPSCASAACCCYSQSLRLLR